MPVKRLSDASCARSVLSSHASGLSRREIGAANLIASKILVPNVVDGKLVSHYASVVITNSERAWISIDSIMAVVRHQIQITTVNITLTPDQSRLCHFMLDRFKLFYVPAAIALQIFPRVEGLDLRMLWTFLITNGTSHLLVPTSVRGSMKNLCRLMMPLSNELPQIVKAWHDRVKIWMGKRDFSLTFWGCKVSVPKF